MADSLKGNPTHVLADESIGPMPLWVRLAAGVIQRQPRGRYRVANWLAAHKAAAPPWGRLSPGLGGVLLPGGRRFDVPARPLDAAGIDRIDVLKMDIEGAEAPALRGLDRRLRTARIRHILLEVHPRHLRDQGSSVEEVVGSRRHGDALWANGHSPATSRRVAAGRLDPRSALTPLTDATDLGSWPHLLCSLTPPSLE